MDGAVSAPGIVLNLLGGRLCGDLLPLVVHADQTAQGTGETNEAVVETSPAEGRRGNGEIAEVRDELELASGSLAGEKK